MAKIGEGVTMVEITFVSSWGEMKPTDDEPWVPCKARWGEEVVSWALIDFGCSHGM